MENFAILFLLLIFFTSNWIVECINCPKDRPCWHDSGSCSKADFKVHDGRGRGYCYAKTICLHPNVCYDARHGCSCKAKRPCKLRGRPNYCIPMDGKRCPEGSDHCVDQSKCPRDKPCLHISGQCFHSDKGVHDGRGRGFCYPKTRCVYPDYCYHNDIDECICVNNRPCKINYPGYCTTKDSGKCPWGTKLC